MLKLGKHEVQTPAVCGSVIGSDIKTMRAGVTKAVEQGADLIELRIDGLRDPTNWEELLHVEVPTVLTNRPKREGGNFEGDEEERVKVLLQGIERVVSCIDVELSTPVHLREQVVSRAEESGSSVIVSYHDFSKTPSIEVLTNITNRLAEAGCDLAKVVTFARDKNDALRVLDFLVQVQNEVTVPVIAFAMGDAGRITRIAAPLFGSPIVYAAAGEATAPGQLNVLTAKRLLRELTS